MSRLMRPAGAGLLALTLLVAAACSDSNPGAGDAAGGDIATSTEVSGQAQAAATPSQVKQSNELTTADLVVLAEPAVVRIATGTGVGTGFVVDSAGYILTNNHVIESSTTGRAATRIEVTLSDGGTYDATIVGTDGRSDLALLKIGASGLKSLTFADLNDVVVGQDVVAMGFALDLDGGEGGSFT